MSEPQTILITGAGRGIGLGLTRQMLARGWRVLAGRRGSHPIEELDRLARQYADRLQALEVDVQDETSTAALAHFLAGRPAPLDVLVNNAGINPDPRDCKVHEVPVANVVDALDVNVVGALRVLQAAAPALARSARPRVVNISSGAGSLAHNSATRPQPAYCISKAALNMLTRCAARDLPGMVVVSVSPGWIRTDMGGSGAELGLDEATEALAATIENLQPAHSGRWLDRFGQPSVYAW